MPTVTETAIETRIDPIVTTVGQAAQEVSKRSQQVGQVASDVQRATNAIEGSKG